MATVINHQQSNNAFLKGIEGNKKWGQASLTYSFAKSENIAEVVTDPKISHVFNAGHDFNPLDAAHNGENGIRNDVLAAMKAWNLVANIPTYRSTTNFDNADIKIAGVSNWGDQLGRMDFPGVNVKGLGTSPSTNYESILLLSTGNLLTDRPETGGAHLGAQNALHELGHGLGLGHPHDHGGSTQAVSHPGVHTAGEVVWDNQRYTVMSYEKAGWNQNVGGTYGFAVTPSALDITAIQNMYGTRAAYTGDTTYTLTDAGTRALDVNGADGTVSIGRAFYSIWDTGGEDKIQYNGSNRSVLNLNNATLSPIDDKRQHDSEVHLKKMSGYSTLPTEIKNNIESSDYHAGGFFSTVFSNSGAVQLGGYSIASDVNHAKAKIENASGGSGNDIIIGNEVSNELYGGNGNDMIVSSDGNDLIFAGAGNDQLAGEAGNDLLDGGAGRDIAQFSDVFANYNIIANGTGGLTVDHARGSRLDGTDSLVSIEDAVFKDGKFALSSRAARSISFDKTASDEFLFSTNTSSADDMLLINPVGVNSSKVSDVSAEGALAEVFAPFNVYEPADEFLL